MFWFVVWVWVVWLDRDAMRCDEWRGGGGEKGAESFIHYDAGKMHTTQISIIVSIIAIIIITSYYHQTHPL